MLHRRTLGRLLRTQLRVAMVWGDRIVQDEVFAAPNPVRVGELPGDCDFVLSDRRLPPCFELFRPVPGGFVLRVTDAAIGRVFVGGEEIDLERLHAAGVSGSVVGEVPLTRGDRGVISLGPVAFVFHVVGDGQALPVLSLVRAVDRSVPPALLAAALLHAAVLVASRLAPVDVADLERRAAAVRLVRSVVPRPAPPPPPAPPAEVSDAPIGEPPPGDAAPAPAGVAGRGPGAKGHGLLSFMKAGMPGLEDVLGDVAGFSHRLGDATKGPGFGIVTAGSGGWGLHGLPGGGVGFGEGYTFGAIPRGGEPGAGVPPPKERARRKVRAKVRHSEPTAVGACDPAAVRRVVQARAAGVRFCYEKQLVRDPDLAGKLTVTWRIAANGRVARAYVTDDRVGDKALARCVTKQVRRWRFPKPRQGAACVIQYPFVFSAGP